MPTARFLPGDKVRVKFADEIPAGLMPGTTYTVAHVDDFGRIQVRGLFPYFSAGVFELAMRGVPDMPCYSLKDGEGDWHFSEESAEGPFLMDGGDGETYRAYETIADRWGIDAEPLPTAKGAEPTHVEVDEVDPRFEAWDRVACHPLFRECYADERPLIDAMMAKLDRIYSEGASPAEEDDGGEYETEMALAYDEPVLAEWERELIAANTAALQEGDRVEYVGGGEVETTSLVGKVGTVNHIDPDDVYVTWDGGDASGDRGVLAENLRKIEPKPRLAALMAEPPVWAAEPKPLRKGDAVQVWAKVVTPEPDADGEVEIVLHRAGRMGEMTDYTLPDAIVRPSAGQVPPWLEAGKAESEAISNITATLRREGGMDYDAAHDVAASLFRAGVRVEVTD